MNTYPNVNVVSLPAYTYHWEKSLESGDYEARCVEIPELSAFGDTPDEAFEEIKTAVSAWLAVLLEDGLPFPVPQNSIVSW